jgi:hypothetical protein
MDRAFLPILVIATHAARRALGPDLRKVAVLAAKAIIRGRKSLEVAHQQIRFAEHDLAFSSRIGARGDLILELDVGDPRLGNRIILEEELQQASKFARWNANRR